MDASQEIVAGKACDRSENLRQEVYGRFSWESHHSMPVAAGCEVALNKYRNPNDKTGTFVVGQGLEEATPDALVTG